MQKSESIAALAKALSQFQGQLQAAPKSEINPFFHSRYADLATVWEAIRGPLAANGLAVSQLPSLDGERLILVTLLLHESGEWIASELVMVPMREKKDIGWQPSMDPQSVGSAITYARRYGLCAALGVVADDDDDAEAAMGRGEHQLGPAPPAARLPSQTASERGNCPVHNVPFVHRQGIGAKGPYDFWACPQKVGAGYCRERSSTHEGAAPETDSASATQPSRPSTPESDSSRQGAAPKPTGELAPGSARRTMERCWAVVQALGGTPIDFLNFLGVKSFTELPDIGVALAEYAKVKGKPAPEWKE